MNVDDERRAYLNKRVPKFFRERQYILDAEGNPFLEPDFLTYIDWWSQVPDIRVAFDKVGEVGVSTVFLMVPHYDPLLGDGKFFFFESMITTEKGERFRRYRTRQEARDGHQEIVKVLLADTVPDDAKSSR